VQKSYKGQTPGQPLLWGATAEILQTADNPML